MPRIDRPAPLRYNASLVVNDMEWIAQSIGLAAAAFAIAGFQFRANRPVFICQMISAALFVVNMALLGAVGGVLLNAVAALRGVFLSLPGRRGATRATFWLVVGLTVGCFALQAGLGLVTRAVDLLLPLQFLVGTVLCYRQDGRALRLGQLFVMSPCCLVYNLSFGLIGGIITEEFNMLSILLALLRCGWNGFERPDTV